MLRPRLRKNAVGLDYGCGPGPALACMIHEDGFAVEKYDLYFFQDRAPLQRQLRLHHLYGDRRASPPKPMEVLSLLASMLEESGQIGVMTGILDDRSGFGDWYYQTRPDTHRVLQSRDSSMGGGPFRMGLWISRPRTSPSSPSKSEAADASRLCYSV